MFRETIQKVIDALDGGVAGILMGYDGIAVESYTVAGSALDIQTVGLELAHIIGQARRASELLPAGALEEMTFRGRTLVVLVRPLNDEYFVALAMTPEGNSGKGRYLLRSVAPQMQAEL